jgi:uncharacterized protein YkwD
MATFILSRRRLLAAATASFATLGLRAAPQVSAGPAPATHNLDEASISASEYCADSQEAKFLSLINSYRKANGVGSLRLSRTLGAAAEHHSRDMARYNYFGHTLHNGTAWSTNIVNHGYTVSGTMAENIAAGNSSAQATFDQWRGSSGHNRNMLNPNLKAIGIGRASKSTSRYGWYWTTTFGGRFDSSPSC